MEKKEETYKKDSCDWRYNASVIADCDCFEDCSMPCPYDKKKSPCDMCGLSGCDKQTCEAYKTYNNRQKKLQQRNNIGMSMEGI